jgi:hypothetical protein
MVYSEWWMGQGGGCERGRHDKQGRGVSTTTRNHDHHHHITTTTSRTKPDTTLRHYHL